MSVCQREEYPNCANDSRTLERIRRFARADAAEARSSG